MKKIAIIAVLTLSVAALAGCGIQNANNQQQTTKEPIKVGLSAPLTGEGASWGQNAIAAATLAVKEVNDAGGINGRQVQLIVEDDKGTNESVNVFNKLVNVDKVDGIVGPLASASAGPALPIAQSAGMPVIMIASAPQLTGVGDYMFRVYPSDAYQGQLGADIVYNQLGKKKAALIYVSNDYGQGVAKSFESKYKELGGTLVYNSSILNGTSDFRSEIAKIKKSGAEAIYMAMYPAGGQMLLKQLAEARLNLPKVGDVTFNDEKTVKSGYADGLIYTEPKTDLKDDFIAKLKSQPEYKDLAVMVAAPFTYDATKALLSAIRLAGGDDHAKIKDALFNVSFPGVSSPVIKFGTDREVINPSFSIMMIKGKAITPYIK